MYVEKENVFVTLDGDILPVISNLNIEPKYSHIFCIIGIGIVFWYIKTYFS